MLVFCAKPYCCMFQAQHALLTHSSCKGERFEQTAGYGLCAFRATLPAIINRAHLALQAVASAAPPLYSHPRRLIQMPVSDACRA